MWYNGSQEVRMSEQRQVLNMRLDPVTAGLMDALAERFGLTRSAVVRQAVRRWAHAEGVEIPRAPREDDLGGAAA